MKKNNKYILLLISIFWVSSTAYAQWDIPAEYKNKKAPTVSTAELISLGQQIYTKNCQSCHGEPTKANGLPLSPPPPDLGNPEYLSTRTEGENFYQLKTGKGAMPSFATTLSEDDRWNVIHYIRSFDPNAVKVETVKLNLALQTNPDNKEIVAMVTQNVEGENIPAVDVKLNFYVKRYFGKLPIAQSVVTNQNGYASTKFPEDLPGTEDGKATVLAGFTDSFIYGKDLMEVEVDFAKQWSYENPLDKPVLWGPNTSTPIWLILLYSTVTIGVWLVILYVAFQLVKLKKAV